MSVDLRDNISALAIAICHKDYLLVEDAFSILEETKHRITNEDREDMIKLKEEGLTYRAIGELYGISDTSVYKMMKRYKAKKETLQGGNLSKVK